MTFIIRHTESQISTPLGKKLYYVIYTKLIRCIVNHFWLETFYVRWSFKTRNIPVTVLNNLKNLASVPHTQSSLLPLYTFADAPYILTVSGRVLIREIECIMALLLKKRLKSRRKISCERCGSCATKTCNRDSKDLHVPSKSSLVFKPQTKSYRHPLGQIIKTLEKQYNYILRAFDGPFESFVYIFKNSGNSRKKLLYKPKFVL